MTRDVVRLPSPCGVPEHEGGRWIDVVLGIWWCPGCGEEIWTTEGVDGADEDMEGPDRGERAARPDGAGLSVLPSAVPDARDAAGAPADRAPGDGFGWRDRPGGQRLWGLIADAFGRDPS